MRTPSFLLALALLLVAAPAASAGTPISNALGTDWYTTFQWERAADDQRPMVIIASTPTLDEGGTISGDRGGGYDIADDATSWRPEYPLHAGRYWWQLTTRDVDYSARNSAPVEFVVPAILAKPTASFTCVKRRELRMRTSWRTNVEELKVSYKITQGRKLVDSVSNYAEWIPTMGVGRTEAHDATYTPFLATTFAKNATFRLQYTISGPGVKFSRTLVARCR